MVRVIVERRCKPGKEAELAKLLAELRTTAMGWQGFVTGQTLRSVDDPSCYVVISTWLDADLWNAWATSAARQKVASKIEATLVVPEKISVFSFVAG